MNRYRVLVIDDEPGFGEFLRDLLTPEGCAVTGVTDPIAGLDRFASEAYQLVITDLAMPGIDGLEVLRRVKQLAPETEVIVITGHATVATAVTAMKQGAFEYLTKPFDADEMVVLVKKALEKFELTAEVSFLKGELAARYRFENIIGQSALLRALIERVRTLAPHDTSVLIRGESGTGKELVARTIHQHSPRRHKKFLAVNCGAIPEALLESELFGHRQGAFTGAHIDRDGIFQAADGGTILLDEVAELPPAAQVKLLRVLQEGEFFAVGASTPTRVNVRILAATHRDLAAAVRQGKFREDLYYRINVVEIVIPPLRERPEDIPLLVEHALTQTAHRHRVTRKRVAAAAMRLLLAHPWPGNVRELEHIIEASVIQTAGEEIEAATVARELKGTIPLCDQLLGIPTFEAARAEFERRYLQNALEKNDYNISRTALQLEMRRGTLRDKIVEYELRPDGNRPTE